MSFTKGTSTNLRNNIMNTPDTEWAVKAIIALLPKTEIVVDIGEGERDTVDLKEVLPYELNRIFTSLLSSRDTYWKERIEGMKVIHFCECKRQCFHTQKERDILLDNLK